MIKVNLSIDIANRQVLEDEMVKIPVIATNFLRYYNSLQVPYEWVDNDVLTFPASEYTVVVPSAERRTWYEFKGLDDVIISRIRIYDYASSISSNPIHIYAVDENWSRTYLVTFTGNVFGQWRTFDFTPVKAKYLVLTGPNVGAGNNSTECEVWGNYTGTYTPVVPAVKPININHQIGVNIYEWSLFWGSTYPGGSTIGARTPNPAKVTALQKYGVVRHYCDWDRLELGEGRYAYQPERSGGWHLDDFYKFFKDNDITVISCLKTMPAWMIASYPENIRGKENRPHLYGESPSNIWSYRQQSMMGFQMAARYGTSSIFNTIGTIRDISELPSTANELDSYYLEEDVMYEGEPPPFDTKVYTNLYTWHDSDWQELITVNSSPRWTNDRRNSVKVNLGTLEWMECSNENNKGWKGRRSYQTAREHAANLSAYYDGHLGTMGMGYGVKTACPGMMVTTCGTVGIDIKYFQGIIDWSKQYRGYLPNGKVNVPFDAINFHSYRDDSDSIQHSGTKTRGMCPEETNLFEALIELRQLVTESLGDNFPIIWGETGYDLNRFSVQRAIEIGNKSREDVQGDWLLRLLLEAARAGIDYTTVYEIVDNDPSGNSTTQYQTSGLNNNDYSPRVATKFFSQVRTFMDGFLFGENLSEIPRVDKWVRGNEEVYAVWSPTEDDSSGVYQLSLGLHTLPILYVLDKTSEVPIAQPLNIASSYNINYSETPVFLKIVI